MVIKSAGNVQKYNWGRKRNKTVANLISQNWALIEFNKVTRVVYTVLQMYCCWTIFHKIANNLA